MNNSLLFIFFLLLIFLLIAGIILYLTPIKKYFLVKLLPSINRLRNSIGLSIENGQGVHISVGRANLSNVNGAASLIGLETLDKILDQSVLSDNPPTITSGSGEIALMSQSKIEEFLKDKSRISHSSIPHAYLSGPTKMSFIAGAISPSSKKDLSSQILVGNFGAEIGLALHAANQRHHFTLSATDALEGQSVSYVYSEEALIGDQIFSIPDQLGREKHHFVSTILLDILRWLIIVFILLLAFLKILGIV
ncbi:MAG TPA: hypothetical protein VK856_01845 [Anaerolineaceae bacterium]|nr:hypothetical protein [Anaerolineaceae bacterium]